MTPETKAKLSAALKAKWASGTRKRNPAGVGKKISATLKAGFADGRIRRRNITPDEAKAMRAAADPRNVARACRKTGLAKRGKANPPGPSAAGTQNMFARPWVLLGPNHKRYEFVNLNEFVRQNAALFDPRDVVWKGSYCRAVKAISSVGSPNDRHTEWKGWLVLKKGAPIGRSGNGAAA